MSSFQLPQWVLHDIDAICRQFLWKSSASAKHGISLFNWDRVCRPKQCGGLGLTNLYCQNRCLLLRWWWRLYEDKQSLWKDIAMLLLARANLTTGPMLWKKSGSFFWKQLMGLRYLFQFSTRWTIQSGERTSYWYDNWGGTPLRPLLPTSDHFVTQKFSTVKKAIVQALTDINQPRSFHDDFLIRLLPSTSGNSEQDSITWRWSSNGEFSAAGIYRIMMSSALVTSPFSRIWSLRLTPTLKLFMFLLLEERLLTQDVLQRRGITLRPYCHFCSSQILETHVHLFSDCSIVSSFIREVAALFDAQLPLEKPLYRTVFARLHGKKIDACSTAIFVAFSFIWRERNARIFTDKKHSLSFMKSDVLQEATWMKQFCY